MFFSRASLVTIALSAISAKAVYFVPLNPADVEQCNTIQLNVKGLAPYTVAVWPGCSDDSETDQPYADYKSNTTTINWKVNVAAGKSVMFEVEDAKGNVDYTEDYTIKPSADNSCVGVKPSFSSPSSPSNNPTIPSGTSSASNTVPTTQSIVAPGNVGGGGVNPSATISDDAPSSSPSGGVIGGLGGAMSNFSPRVEMAALVVLGSSIASLIF